MHTYIDISIDIISYRMHCIDYFIQFILYSLHDNNNNDSDIDNDNGNNYSIPIDNLCNFIM